MSLTNLTRVVGSLAVIPSARDPPLFMRRTTPGSPSDTIPCAAQKTRRGCVINITVSLHMAVRKGTSGKAAETEFLPLKSRGESRAG